MVIAPVNRVRYARYKGSVVDPLFGRGEGVEIREAACTALDPGKEEACRALLDGILEFGQTDDEHFYLNEKLHNLLQLALLYVFGTTDKGSIPSVYFKKNLDILYGLTAAAVSKAGCLSEPCSKRLFSHVFDIADGYKAHVPDPNVAVSSGLHAILHSIDVSSNSFSKAGLVNVGTKERYDLTKGHALFAEAMATKLMTLDERNVDAWKTTAFGYYSGSTQIRGFVNRCMEEYPALCPTARILEMTVNVLLADPNIPTPPRPSRGPSSDSVMDGPVQKKPFGIMMDPEDVFKVKSAVEDVPVQKHVVMNIFVQEAVRRQIWDR